MRKIRTVLCFVICLYALECCIVSKTKLNSGLVIQGHRTYDLNGKEIKSELTAYDNKMLFMDSCVIFEMGSVFTYTDPHKKQTTSHLITSYIYLNLKTMIFYEYKNFSDTAKLIRMFSTHPDSTNLTWKFYRRKQLAPSLDNLLRLPDTIINNKSYSRLRCNYNYINKDKNVTTTFTYYMTCGQDKPIFHIDRVFDEKIDTCHAVRVDYYISGSKEISTSFYEIISNNLSSFEQLVFKKWANNALSTNLPLEHSWHFENYEMDSIRVKSMQKN
jgi:hypothetical protein